jgi:hypothetical protein
LGDRPPAESPASSVAVSWLWLGIEREKRAMELELHITLGNDAMQSTADLAEALTVLASRISDQSIDGMLENGLCNVRDINGNPVGTCILRREAAYPHTLGCTPECAAERPTLKATPQGAGLLGWPVA